MPTSIISVVDSPNIARKLIKELSGLGLHEKDVQILDGDQTELREAIGARGFDTTAARTYAEAAAGGKTVVVAVMPEAKADSAMAIMDRFEAGEVESVEEEEGGREEEIAAAEEELSVSKRKEVQGGVRATTRVTEKPVEETVRLREEKVGIERRPVDRELRADEADEAFKEQTVEMLATNEEAEISKETRVVEEVALQKEVEEREETVRDKVRTSDVEVERIKPRSGKGQR